MHKLEKRLLAKVIIMRNQFKKMKTALTVKKNAQNAKSTDDSNKLSHVPQSEGSDAEPKLDDISMQEMWKKLHIQTKQINEQLLQLNNHKLVQTYNSLPRFIWFSLVKGIAVGLGSVLGATVVLSFLVYILSQMEFIPIIGEWVSAILEVVKGPEAN